MVGKTIAISMVAIAMVGKTIAISMVGQAIAVGTIVSIGISLSIRGRGGGREQAESSNGNGLHDYLFLCKLEEIARLSSGMKEANIYTQGVKEGEGAARSTRHKLDI